MEISNVTDFVSNAVNDTNSTIASVLSAGILFLKALGILAIVYIIYLIIKAIFSWKQRRAIYRIEEKLITMDEKIDKILQKTNKKSKKED